MTMIIGKNYIGGNWCDGEGEIENRNPARPEEIVGRFARAGDAQVRQAIDAAHAAAPAWARMNPQLRSELLTAIGDALFARRQELGTLLSREEGKTVAEGVGEVTRGAQIFRFQAGECLRQAGDLLASIRGTATIEVTREPVGVIGIITPWNFPTAIPAWKIAPALAHGNTVVFKPAELVPASAHALAEIIAFAGLPAGVFNLVMGPGRMIGRLLTESDKVDAISFTGSVATGRGVAAACVSATKMKKFQLEMGGKNPLVVLDDADLEVAVDCMVQGSYFSTGQRCTASSRIIVTEGIHDQFVEAVSARIGQLKVGDPLQDGVQIGPVVDQGQLDQDLSYISVGQAEGARLYAGGRQIQTDTGGHFLTPALFTDVTPQMRISREEIFGPVAGVIRVASYDEALMVANDTEFGLSAGICTTNLKHAAHFRRNAQAGMVMVNMPTAGVDYHVPFGGTKGSSYGAREQGRHAVEFFTTVKTAYIQA